MGERKTQGNFKPIFLLKCHLPAENTSLEGKAREKKKIIKINKPELGHEQLTGRVHKGPARS